MELQIIDVFTLSMALAALIIAVFVAARQGKNVDQATAEKLAEMHKPEVMDRMERMYQQANEPVKQLVNAVTGILQLVSVMTPFKSVDAAADVMTDIQTPGPAPVEAQPG